MVTFTFDALDADAIGALQRERAKIYDATPGLIAKTFWLDAGANQSGAFYLWESHHAADALFTAEWRERVRKLYGAETLEVRYLDVTAEVASAAHA
jgi:hypothetical protein